MSDPSTEKPQSRLAAWRAEQPWVVSVLLWDLVVIGVLTMVLWGALSSAGVSDAAFVAVVWFSIAFPLGLLGGSFRRSTRKWWPWQ